MKCPYCGSENPDDKKFCGDCGSALKSVISPRIEWQRRLARQTGYIFVLISILLIIIGLGIKGQADAISDYFEFGPPLSEAFLDLAWLFGLLGVAGFFVAGLAYLFSLPTIVKNREEVKAPLQEERKEGQT